MAGLGDEDHIDGALGHEGLQRREGGGAAVRRCGGAAVHRCGGAQVRRCTGAEVWRRGGAAVRRRGGAAVRRCGGRTCSSLSSSVRSSPEIPLPPAPPVPTTGSARTGSDLPPMPRVPADSATSAAASRNCSAASRNQSTGGVLRPSHDTWLSQMRGCPSARPSTRCTRLVRVKRAGSVGHAPSGGPSGNHTGWLKLRVGYRTSFARIRRRSPCTTKRCPGVEAPPPPPSPPLLLPPPLLPLLPLLLPLLLAKTRGARGAWIGGRHG